jgi:NTE family protein
MHLTTALVLGGGGALGAAEVGMLRAVAGRGVRPDIIVGSTVGALKAAFLQRPPRRSAVA